MTHKRGSVIVGGLVVLGLLTAPSVIAAARPGAEGAGAAALSAGTAHYQNAELEAFFEAKTAVFENDWPAARSGMERYLRDYPAGKMRDEALYWLGRSFDRLARNEETVARVIELKTRAAETLDRMIREFPKSLWRDDAQELRVTIAGELAVLGVSSERKIVEEAALSQNKTEVEVRRVALNSLGKLDPKTAIPALRDVLAKEPDPRLRKECVSILGRKSPRDVSAILENTSRNDKDEGVRAEARYWLEKIRVRLIPVQLNYYCFEARLTDPSTYGKVPEGEIAAFSLPHGRSGVKAGIQKAFDGRVSLSGSRATSEGATEVFETMKTEGTTYQTSHLISGFRMAVDGGSIVKTPDSISGRVLVDDMVSPFKVDRQSDVLLAARRGERLAVMYLEIAPKDVAAFEKAADEDSISGLASFFQSVGKLFRGKSKEPVYYTKSILSRSGLVIHSTLHSTPDSMPEYSKEGVFDYSLAKAEIPGPGGTWTLTGHILRLNKENVLVGRMAKLVKPDGKVAWEGDEVRVPVADPSAFTTATDTGPAPMPAPPAEIPLAVEAMYPVSFNLDGGSRIHSSRTEFRLEELSSDVLDFGEAKAVMPGPGGSWVLAGHLILMRNQNGIMAREAVLKNAEGKVVAEAAILMVPIKNPENYTLAKARGN
jgi:hypothetical protein